MGWTGRRGRLVLLVFLALLAVVATSPAVSLAQPSQSPTTPDQLTPTEDQQGGTPTPLVDDAVGTEPDTGTEPTDDTDQEPEPSPTGDGEPGPEEGVSPIPTESPADGESGDDGGVAPSVRRSGIPVATTALAIGVLAMVALAALVLGRRSTRSGDAIDDNEPPRASPVSTPSPSPEPDPAADRELVAFLLELGKALIDTGDSVDRIGMTLSTVARMQGLSDVGVIVLPTALMISASGRGSVQTDVSTAGASPLRLDQTEAVLRLVERAEDGDVGAAQGRAELTAIRASKSPVPPGLALVGHALAAIGLALLLRGGLVEVALAGAMGAVVGVLRLVVSPRESNLRPFMPLVASFLVATAVLLTARVTPGLAVLPPLIAPLIPLLPGAMLTMGTLELATGQALSGVARLGSGGLQLVLLAGGIIGAVQFVGIPGPGDVVAAASSGSPEGVLGVLAPWFGVAAFGLGIGWARGARRSSLPWILIVLFVAYAGQIVGGVFFGDALSAFFGALAMTPVAVYASRQDDGPPALVTFLPAFWLLVPGALGLQGVTRILNEDGVQGLATLVTTGAAMVGIALGILLGLLLAEPDRWRLRQVDTSNSEPSS